MFFENETQTGAGCSALVFLLTILLLLSFLAASESLVIAWMRLSGYKRTKMSFNLSSSRFKRVVRGSEYISILFYICAN